ncbi:hypothetical protein F2Q70_00028188 [Brassica cretica]|uniref:Uncharacterized protein n=5 Tax=Brassica TaxID=3705 RepID=A0A8S9LBU9_BRACR|nr:PREDICTED: uncharacterized protein LOC106339378 [Brassica oleracea var. oleracea]XP_013633628.1 PREDICTED: uncharacterized protein LOC106339378 [Brassica oleracea var. oleracea]XP_013633629.1 PREDICTED: uncharacterized protein LOC106339378 [Brassica oleracea var. oleracea]XP_013698538.1 uncharacterized protein BNAC04G41540D [Brassica napus]XP_013698539.1 uncharacterized protein BNAC04G41540D [Brassica napus]XP_048609952.1 uncharacterized protein BNAC04G41540D [Brassica napus]XP_048609953.1
MASFLDKAASTLNEAKESVTATVESVGASLTDAQKNVAASTETARTSLADAQETVAATTETVKTEAEAAPGKVSDVSTQARDVLGNYMSRGIEGAKTLIHGLEEKKTEVSTKLVGAFTNAVGGASSSTTVASRDLPISTDNQPLLTGERGVDTTPWWKNCCGVLDLLKTSTTK